MNENTTKLIEQLAAKLGTTSQYLWGILIKQAPVDATIALLQFMVTIAVGFTLYKVHKRLLRKENPNERYSESLYSKYKEGAVLPMIIGLIMFIFLFISCMIDFDRVINGYFNPEYWALHEILSKIK